MHISYEKPEVSDIPDIEKLLQITFMDTFQKNSVSSIFDINEEIQSKIINAKRDIIEHNSKYYFLIAKAESKAIGICAYFPVSEIIRNYIDKASKEDLEVGCMYIYPEYQKMGIGKRLFDMIISKMKENGIKHYYLSSGFESSQKYWKERLGDPIHIIENIWGMGKHEIIWKVAIE